MRDEERAVGLASVYRAVDVLARLGLVRRIDVDGIACFEPADPSGEHHHHAICDRCGRLDAFEDPELEALIEGVAQRLGYAIEGHDVVLRGACPGCWPDRCRIAFGPDERSFRPQAVFQPIVIRRRLNRREAIGLGAAAVAGGALRPAPALAGTSRSSA